MVAITLALLLVVIGALVLLRLRATKKLRDLETEAEVRRGGPKLWTLTPLGGLKYVAEEIALGEGRYALGRDETNDIVLNSPFISRHHAILYVSKGKVTIRCLEGAKGIYLRKAKGEVFEDCENREVEVEPGDVVALGKPKLQNWFSIGPLRETGKAERTLVDKVGPRPVEAMGKGGGPRSVSRLPEGQEEERTVAISYHEEEEPTFRLSKKEMEGLKDLRREE